MSIAWIKRTLRLSLYAPRRVNVLAAYIVGSVAKGTARPDSDLDIAVVIPPVRGKTSLAYTEAYHAKFPSDNVKPDYDGRRVDFQFFYPGEIPASYAKLDIPQS